MSRRGIGGTDLGAVCSYYRPELAPTWAKWANACDLWMRLVHDVERPRTAIMQRGVDAEPRLRRVYLQAYGGRMDEKPTPWIVPHPRLPFVTVSPDDVWRRDDEGEPVYVEFKSTSIFAMGKYGEPETDQVPPSYGMQVQLGLEILNLPVAHLFAGFGRDIKEDGKHQFLYEATHRYVIKRDTELMAMALGFAERFHNEFVLTRTPPSGEPVSNKLAWKRLMKEANK